eukprot:gene2973-3419_t
MDTGNLHNPEHELLSRLREGDADSFKEIYERYRQRVYLYALKISKSDDVADEIAQEVFIRLWEKRMQINTEMSFEGYIKKITLHHVLNHLKKVARERTLQEQVFVYIDQIRNSTEEGIYEKELVRVYHEAVEQLPPQKKLIYKMSRNEELTHDEIAEKLNISKNTVKNHMVEATKFIRSSVNKHGSIICFLMAATNYFHRN